MCVQSCEKIRISPCSSPSSVQDPAFNASTSRPSPATWRPEGPIPEWPSKTDRRACTQGAHDCLQQALGHSWAVVILPVVRFTSWNMHSLNCATVVWVVEWHLRPLPALRVHCLVL